MGGILLEPAPLGWGASFLVGDNLDGRKAALGHMVRTDVSPKHMHVLAQKFQKPSSGRGKL